jgi:carbon-monoxide dehydrogenase medium subunit
MLALLLDAELEIQSASGRRQMAARDFFRGALSVELAADEMLVEIRIPMLPPTTGWGFAEVARRAGDFALAAAAATITVAAGVVRQARIAVTGVGETPQRMSEAEALLTGRTLEPALLVAVREQVRAAVEPGSDLHASSDYRRHLVGVLAQRAAADAWRRATEGIRL